MSNRRGRRQVQAYDPAETERLRCIVLPPKIKCHDCRHNLPLTRFSEKQLNDARCQIDRNSRISVRCQNCTGQQVMEIECTFCFKTKGREEFAKSQRAKLDTAKCYKCTDEQVTRQPINEDKYENSDNAFVTPDSSDGVQPDYWATVSSTAGTSTNGDWATVNGEENDNEGGISLSHQFRQAMSINGSVPETLIDSEYSSLVGGVNNHPHGDGFSEVRSRSWRTPSTDAASTGSGFDPNRYGRPAATTKAGTEHTYASTVAERSTTTNVRANGWPGISRDESTGAAGPVRSPFVRPSGDAQAEVKEDANPWSDNESDEEEDGGDSDDDSDGENTVI